MKIIAKKNCGDEIQIVKDRIMKVTVTYRSVNNTIKYSILNENTC